MVTGLIAKKLDQTQGWLLDGTRVPITRLLLTPNIVTQVKITDKDGYSAVQLGFGIRKHTNKPLNGHFKKAGLKQTPRFLREIRVESLENILPSAEIKAVDVFEPGDTVDITGVSKGKGFAGVVKRHHFAGGPRTHGQSDRERAPGSIGQSTTPGRVYKGKRMAGRMGNERVTTKNLEVLDIVNNEVYIKGLVPGPRGGIVILKKVGKAKKFVSLFKEVEENASKES